VQAPNFSDPSQSGAIGSYRQNWEFPRSGPPELAKIGSDQELPISAIPDFSDTQFQQCREGLLKLGTTDFSNDSQIWQFVKHIFFYGIATFAKKNRKNSELPDSLQSVPGAAIGFGALLDDGLDGEGIKISDS